MIYQDKNKYEHSEKYRAEVFKFAGYALCTPFGLNILSLVSRNSGAHLERDLTALQITGSLILLTIGVLTLAEGYSIMLRLDRRVAQ